MVDGEDITSVVIVSGQLANKLCNAAGEDVEAKDYDQTWLGTTLILGMLATPLGIYVHSSKPPPLDGVLCPRGGGENRK